MTITQAKELVAAAEQQENDSALAELLVSETDKAYRDGMTRAAGLCRCSGEPALEKAILEARDRKSL